MNYDTKLFLSTLGVFIVAYIFTFPMGWLISDEYSYFNQGLAIANGQNALTFSDGVSGETIRYNQTPYTLGNAFWIAFWIKIFGSKYAYFGSLFSVAASSLLIYSSLRKYRYQSLATLFLFLYPSLVFFSKSFMSSIPSLLLVCAFVYLLFTLEDSGKKCFFLSMLAALSFWFRETNLILLGGISLINFILDKKWFFHYAIGALIGILPRIMSSYYYYDDPFLWVLAESFSIQNAINNLVVYAILLLLLLPLGIVFILRYRGAFKTPIVTSSMLYILAYLCYGFNATEYSGFQKGVILMGRFMIPILPIYIIASGWAFRNKSISKWLKITALVTTCFLTIAMQTLLYKEAVIHKSISTKIYAKYGAEMVIYDLSRRTNIIRYINPIHGNLQYSTDISNLNDAAYMSKLFAKFDKAYIIQTLNTANPDKSNLTASTTELVANAATSYQVEEVESFKIKPALYLQVIKISPGYGKDK